MGFDGGAIEGSDPNDPKHPKDLPVFEAKTETKGIIQQAWTNRNVPHNVQSKLVENKNYKGLNHPTVFPKLDKEAKKLTDENKKKEANKEIANARKKTKEAEKDAGKVILGE